MECPRFWVRSVQPETCNEEITFHAGSDHQDPERASGGRPPFDPVLMFKILVIQTLNNL
ncbi:transposase [Acetobacter papayae]|uniref:transposase n=1 Tax=Acetobacter papayae TaxID=1076592 RepID=UPI00131F251D